jgi:hypothetical protein
MRKFVAACCCVIVGLEVLIGVPLVVCVIAFAYMGAPGTSVMVSSQPVDFSPSACSNPAVVPAPDYSHDYAATPTPIPMALTGSYVPATSTMPAVCPPPPSPEVTAIAQVRQQNGSPLDGTVVAPSNAASSIGPFVAAVEQIAANETACLMPPPVAPNNPVADANPVESPTAPAAPQPGNLVEALRVCSDQLYVKANDLEASGNYGRADEVRGLARRIREEIQTLVAEAPVIPLVPSTVTAATFDPQAADPAPAANTTETAARKPSVPLADPTVPSALPPASPEQPLILTVQPQRIVIQDEVEANLPPEQNLPTIPAP